MTGDGEQKGIIQGVRPLIQLSQVRYGYPGRGGTGRAALQGVDLTIGEGEWLAVVGANGSGKTTLARLCCGLLLPDAGWVQVAGMDTAQSHLRAEVHSRVGMVFQSPEDQVVATTVAEDVAFGLENLQLAPREILRRVEETLRSVGLWELRDRPPHLLSAGQIQRLALAGVLALRPKAVIFDEATAMLDPQGRHLVEKWMRRLHMMGVTVISVTHFMDEAALAQRVLVMHEGRLVMDDSPAQVFADRQRLEHWGLELPPAADLTERLRPYLPELPQGLYTGETLLAALKRCVPFAAVTGALVLEKETARARQVFEVRGLQHTYLKETPFASCSLQNCHLSVGQGEIHGLAGATGSGKSTLLQHLNGLLKPQAGQVWAFGQALHEPGMDWVGLRRRVGLVFQNPEVQFFEPYVGDEVAFGPRLAGVEDLRTRVRWAMEAVGLDFELFKDRWLMTLSGGEKRRVALASALALQPEALLLDEPTAGLDPHTRRAVLRLLRNLGKDGKTLLLSSHRMEDLAWLCGRLTICARGQDVWSGSAAEAFGATLDLSGWGLEPPLAARAAQVLRERGWPLPHGVARPSALVQALEGLRQ